MERERTTRTGTVLKRATRTGTFSPKESHKDRHHYEARGSMASDWQELNRRADAGKLNVFLIVTVLAEVVAFDNGYIIQVAFIQFKYRDLYNT